jgi:transposase
MWSTGGTMKRHRSRGKVKAVELEIIRRDVAGLDLGSREHYVCAPASDGEGRELEHFGSTTAELHHLVRWLKERGVRSVAMESTGVYWIPVYEVLESQEIEVVLVNARALKSVPGRKTDVLDCQWIQLLHSCGLLKGAFRPSDEVCAVRALIRERGTLTQSAADWIRRMQKCLDQMNICVHHAVADLTGVTGMAIVRAIVAGERDPKILAGLRDPRCHKSVEQIAAHLEGNWRSEHVFVLGQALQTYDFLQARIAEFDQEIMRSLSALERAPMEARDAAAAVPPEKMRRMRKRGQAPLHEALCRMSGADLTTIDGIGVETAQIVLSEIGRDLEDFPTEKHFVSYLKLVPKLAISGGKPVASKRRLSTTTRVGAALRMAATTLRHSKTALGAEFRRLSRIKGAGVAVFAMARKLAVQIYRLLKFGQTYVDQGVQAYEERFRQRRIAACHQMAKSLGLCVLPMETATQ